MKLVFEIWNLLRHGSKVSGEASGGPPIFLVAALCTIVKLRIHWCWTDDGTMRSLLAMSASAAVLRLRQIPITDPEHEVLRQSALQLAVSAVECLTLKTL